MIHALAHTVGILGWAVLVLAVAGTVYTGLAAVFLVRFFHGPPPLAPEGELAPFPHVTILKPLHGDEPGLRHNLATFFAEAQAGAQAEIVLGVQDRADPALAVVETLRRDHPGVQAALSIDEERHGRNAKVSNLMGMAPHAHGEVLILSDSDIEAPPAYLPRVLAALAQPGVGLVTCPYFGKGETGFWSRVAAMGLSWQFMPSVITGVSLGMAKPCMGSTIALRAETLDRIGGFAAFRDVLADDYLMGAAVRGLGLKTVVAPILVGHSCAETSLGEVFAHELRWSRTVKSLDFPGFVGSVMTHPLALAILAALLTGLAAPALVVVGLALIARVVLSATADRAAARRTASLWLIPLRDVLSFCVFVGSFFGRAVAWRGETFHVTADGDLVSAQRP